MTNINLFARHDLTYITNTRIILRYYFIIKIDKNHNRIVYLSHNHVLSSRRYSHTHRSRCCWYMYRYSNKVLYRIHRHLRNTKLRLNNRTLSSLWHQQIRRCNCLLQFLFSMYRNVFYTIHINTKCKGIIIQKETSTKMYPPLLIG